MDYYYYYYYYYYLVVTEKIMVCLATLVMTGIISTGITEGKGRAGLMIPIPGYSMYQARLLQHNTPGNTYSCHLASLPA